MALRVGINGLGRTGRALVRIAHERAELGVEVVAANDAAGTRAIARLLAHDTVHGRFPGEVAGDDGHLTVGGRTLPVSHATTPQAIDWAAAGVEIGVEATGRWTGCEVVSTDIHPDIVRQAQENVARTGAPTRVLQARFFAAVEGAFDCITFNIPYVPTRLLSSPGDFQSDGGPEGTSVIEAFLDAFVARGGRARALLGVNRIFVPPDRFLPLLAARPELVLEKTVRPPLWPVVVYEIRRREAAVEAR